MSEIPSAAANEISENDILFDCPNCRKNLTIDRRAEGMVIQCPDCGQDVVVPGYISPYIGQDVPLPSDDRVLVLERALAVSQAKALELADTLAATQRHHQRLERLHDANIKVREVIGREIGVIQNALDRVRGAIEAQVKQIESDK